MPTPSFNVESSQSTSTFLAAFKIAGFFSGTTDETTTFLTFCPLNNPVTTPLESLIVAIRLGAKTRIVDANASFVYELLISTNK
jgi:hypothetical protein